MSKRFAILMLAATLATTGWSDTIEEQIRAGKTSTAALLVGIVIGGGNSQPAGVVQGLIERPLNQRQHVFICPYFELRNKRQCINR